MFVQVVSSVSMLCAGAQGRRGEFSDAVASVPAAAFSGLLPVPAGYVPLRVSEEEDSGHEDRLDANGRQCTALM